MNDNTILRIKVPAHLYESVKQQLTLNEAKAKPHYGAGMEVVKEKKMKVPKDGMKKMEEEKVEETVSEAAVDPNLIGGILGMLLGGGPIVAAILRDYKNAKTPEEKAEVLKNASKVIGGKMSGNMEEAKEEKVEEAKDEEKKEEDK